MNRRDAIVGAASAVLAFSASATRADVIEPRRARRRTQRESEPLPKGAVSPRAAREGVALLTDVRQAQRFTDEQVKEEDVRKIVMTGLNAPSALNLQPWFFSVVADREMLREIDAAAKVDPTGRLSCGGSPLVIFISTNESDYGKYDVGVAADRMNVCANLLGYGCKTVATAAKAANEPKFKDRLGTPKDYKIIAALLIGKEIERSVDGVSGATTREPVEKKFAFVGLNSPFDEDPFDEEVLFEALSK